MQSPSSRLVAAGTHCSIEPRGIAGKSSSSIGHESASDEPDDDVPPDVPPASLNPEKDPDEWTANMSP